MHLRHTRRVLNPHLHYYKASMSSKHQPCAKSTHSPGPLGSTIYSFPTLNITSTIHVSKSIASSTGAEEAAEVAQPSHVVSSFSGAIRTVSTSVTAFTFHSSALSVKPRVRGVNNTKTLISYTHSERRNQRCRRCAPQYRRRRPPERDLRLTAMFSLLRDSHCLCRIALTHGKR